MKFLLVFFISLLSTAAFACNDFSGKYKDKKMEVYTFKKPEG